MYSACGFFRIRYQYAKIKFDTSTQGKQLKQHSQKRLAENGKFNRIIEIMLLICVKLSFMQDAVQRLQKELINYINCLKGKKL